MKSQLFYSLSFIWLAFVVTHAATFVVTHAAISPEVYWKVKLPNTQMPQAIEDFLPQADHNTDSNQKVYYGTHQYGLWPWHHEATEDEIRELKSDNYKPYFLEKELKKRKIINFPPLKNKNDAPFLPRQSVESIPFSSKKIPQILNHFSIDSNSKDAQMIKKAIKFCEEPEMKEEKKFCATSLESMVDFILSVLGTNNILAITTKVEGETPMLQKYTIEEVQQISDGDDMVCHKLNYAYAVHYCHAAGSTKTFMVSMIGANGTRVKAVSVCHKDTSFWTPKGLPFVLLNVKPGTTPICHFLPNDQIVFVPSN